ncbi:MAG: FCD domain-containing protein [Pseudomonadota bacterium]|nr:FCD domain-containing protein [Pseudomonadota bacterium]
MRIFQPIRHAKTAEEVAHQIEALVLEGVLRVGERLPGERELATETGVSRPIVREAIGRLERSGLLVARQGEGTFVGDVIGSVFSPQISALLASHHKALFDHLEYRREVEAITARFAAERATASDRALLGDLVGRMAKAFEADDFEAEARIDIEFHSTIGEIAYNLVLLHTLRACYRLLSEGVFRSRTRLYRSRGARRALYEQHRAIADAVLAGDGEAAAHAAQRHIDYVVAAMHELEAREDRERVSGLRLARREDRPAGRRARNKPMAQAGTARGREQA